MPINVLTGLDYWLDNLMCNVPEVAMCFHIDGIVQVRRHSHLSTKSCHQCNTVLCANNNSMQKRLTVTVMSKNVKFNKSCNKNKTNTTF